MSELVETKEDLIRYFTDGVKPRERWRIGTEYEKIAVGAQDGRALPFSGPNGVERILKSLADRFGWEPEEEHGRVLALKRGPARITIEPGAQIELSGEQCETIHCAHREFTQHIEELIEVGHGQGATLLGLGMQPVSRIDEIELLPKVRYRIMYPYMARKGRLGQRMMKQTAGVQANLDYCERGGRDAQAAREHGNRAAALRDVRQLAAERRRPQRLPHLSRAHLDRYRPGSLRDARFRVPRRRRFRGLRRIRARRSDVFHHPQPRVHRHDSCSGDYFPRLHEAGLRPASRDRWTTGAIT